MLSLSLVCTPLLLLSSLGCALLLLDFQFLLSLQRRSVLSSSLVCALLLRSPQFLFVLHRRSALSSSLVCSAFGELLLLSSSLVCALLLRSPQFLFVLHRRSALSSSLVCSAVCELLLLIHCSLMTLLLRLLQSQLGLHLLSLHFRLVIHRRFVISSALLLFRGYGQPPLVVRLVSFAAFADPLHCRRLVALDFVHTSVIRLGVDPVG